LTGKELWILVSLKTGSASIDKVLALSDRIEAEVIRIRQDIHRHPELSFKEERTARLVADRLRQMGVKVTEGIAGNGVIGIIEGRRAGKTVALRADMDALPIQENSGLAFESVNPGVMHACGHDFHTANLLGAAYILSNLRQEWDGTLKLIFQTGEENGGGAREMIKEGILETPRVEALIGMHVLPAPMGRLSLGCGASTAYSDRITLTVKGKQAHTSKPQEGVDAIVIAAQVINALQTVLTRQIDPMEPATFSLGTIHGGSASNIVPDFVEIVGTLRCFSLDIRETIKTSIAKIASSIAAGMGGECNVAFREGYPAVVNDERLTNIVKDVACSLYGKIGQNTPEVLSGPVQEIIRMDGPRLVAEDFGFYSQRAPSCLYWVGIGNLSPLHSSTFTINEDIAKITLPLMSAAALAILLREIES
jgi:amidohydrolase